MMPAAVPPGRAGRLWLLARLDVARRAADLLDRKERLLLSEERRLRDEAERAGSDWAERWQAAETWTARAAVVGGRRDLCPAPGPPARAEITWRETMGISYPSGARCRLPEEGPRRRANPALGPAVAANRLALEAAVVHAAAARAHALVSSELAATRRRRRAITERWMPALESALAELGSRLDELELEERVRSRWSHGHRSRAG